jgi:crotonobetainyl-CoA hydratase/dehydration protein DpgD
MTGIEDDTRVRYEKKNHVAYITLARPAVLNAMDLQMHDELAGAWNDVETDDDIRVAVLTGAGERSFSVGQDMKERARLNRLGAQPATFSSREQPGWPRLTERFTMSKPVIARVNGYALGGGFELALACDIIVASEQAIFALPEAKLGLIPGAGGAFRLARQLPLKVAMGHLLTGRPMTASTALHFGLINEVVEHVQLDRCVAAWTNDVMRSAPLSVRAIKESVMRSLDMPLDEAFSAQYSWEERRRRSQDAYEGVQAFAEKRDPVWCGH